MLDLQPGPAVLWALEPTEYVLVVARLVSSVSTVQSEVRAAASWSVLYGSLVYRTLCLLKEKLGPWLVCEGDVMSEDRNIISLRRTKYIT